MQIVKAKFIEKIERTATVCSFRFAPQLKVFFKAGQFLQVLFNAENLMDRELNKFLSYSNAPQDDYIEVTKRLSASKFSDKLRNLKIGDEVSLKGPLGNCVLAPNHNEIVFLIGGIGVTPCISMLLDLANNNFSDYGINIFYANRNEQEIAFKNEFDELVKKYPRNLRIFHILSECNISDFDCIVGMIREDVIAQKIKDIHSKYFYIFGPPAMVNAMKGVCNNLGCPKDKVISESFIGY